MSALSHCCIQIDFSRYGGRLISYGEYSTTQFFIVFIGVIFSGEAAAQFFSYTTSLTKSATAANYIFWLRRLKPAVQEDSSRPPFEDDGDRGPAHIEVQDVAFAYESRPHAKVLKGIDINVSNLPHSNKSLRLLTTCRPIQVNLLL